MPTSHIKIDMESLAFELKARAKAVREIATKATLDAALETQPQVVKATPVDTGFLAGSWIVKGAAAANSELGIVGRPTELRNDAPYAGIIEKGTRPFKPPFKPLYEWAKRKAGDLALGGMIQISPNAFRRTKRRLISKTGQPLHYSESRLVYKGKASLTADDDQVIRRFVFAVIAKIARVGLRPKHTMLNALPFANAALKRAMERHIAEIRGKKLTGPGAGGAPP